VVDDYVPVDPKSGKVAFARSRDKMKMYIIASFILLGSTFCVLDFSGSFFFRT
jgi:hypothetical protein